MNRPVFVRRAAAVLLLLAAVALPGAAHAADRDQRSTGVPPGGAWIRTGHFVPGMGTTTVALTPQDGSGTTTLAQRADYGDVSDYTKLAPGTYTATVRESTAAASSAPLLSRSFTVRAGDARSVAVVGTADQPRLALLADDLTPPAPGTARVRVLSASQDAGALTVTAVGGPTLAEGAVLGQASAYATVPAGSWTLRLTGDGDGTSSRPVPVASGSIYTVVALDGSSGIDVRVVTDAAGAVTAPRGGAKTGGGWAAQEHAPLPLVLLLAGLACAAGAGVAARRRGAVR